MTTDYVDFGDRVASFLDELAALLTGVIEFDGSLVAEILDDKAAVDLVGPNGNKTGALVTIGGQPAAGLVVKMALRPDRSGKYIAVRSSAYSLNSRLERNPLFRLEFIDDMNTKPAAHWQVHAQRGALSNILTLAGHDRPHQLSALHIPVGGTRMRPCLEDFLQFAIEECGVDAKPGYAAILDDGRRKWRLRQLGAMMRDSPEDAARIMDDLGYDVAPRSGAHPAATPVHLTHW